MNEYGVGDLMLYHMVGPVRWVESDEFRAQSRACDPIVVDRRDEIPRILGMDDFKALIRHAAVDQGRPVPEWALEGEE